MNIKGISLGAVAVLSASALFSTGVALADLVQPSQADFTVVSDDTTDVLNLDEVPTFHFGNVSGNDIYNGSTKTAQTIDTPHVKVTDNRIDGTGWSLSVANGGFGHSIATSSALHLSADTDSETGTTGFDKINVSEDDGDTPLTGSTSHGVFTMPVNEENNTLTIDASPNADLTGVDSDTPLSAELTWTLSPTSNSFASALK